jgi:hypothetical protein
MSKLLITAKIAENDQYGGHFGIFLRPATIY